MTDAVDNPGEKRRAEFYYQPWTQEAVNLYFYSKVQQQRAELGHQLGIRTNKKQLCNKSYIRVVLSDR